MEESRREAIRIDRSRRREAQERLLRQAAVNTILFFLWLVSISEGHLLSDPQIRFYIFPLLIRFDTSSLETWLYFENSCRLLKAYIVLYYCLLASPFRFLRLLCYRLLHSHPSWMPQSRLRSLISHLKSFSLFHYFR